MRGILNDRYAEALLHVAFKRGQVQEYSEDLEAMNEVVGNNPGLVKFFNNPRTDFRIKEDVIETLLSDDDDNMFFVNFLKILIEHRRFGAIPGILREYLVIAKNYYDILTIVIETPVELPGELIEEIKIKCARRFNVQKVREIVILNESLIGGMKIIAGNTVIDSSLKKQLDDIEKLMKD